MPVMFHKISREMHQCSPGQGLVASSEKSAAIKSLAEARAICGNSCDGVGGVAGYFCVPAVPICRNRQGCVGGVTIQQVSIYELERGCIGYERNPIEKVGGCLDNVVGARHAVEYEHEAVR